MILALKIGPKWGGGQKSHEFSSLESFVNGRCSKEVARLSVPKCRHGGEPKPKYVCGCHLNLAPTFLSTMLAFVLLANSKSYVFMTFFKVFFMVVTFGLFQVI